MRTWSSHHSFRLDLSLQNILRPKNKAERLTNIQPEIRILATWSPCDAIFADAMCSRQGLKLDHICGVMVSDFVLGRRPSECCGSEASSDVDDKEYETREYGFCAVLYSGYIG